MADTNMMLKFKMGNWSANFDSITKQAGTVYITKNEKAMYVDVDNNTRIRIGDIIQVANAAAAEPPFSAGTFYYFIEENALMRWDGTKWTQVNSIKEIKAAVKALEDAIGDIDALGEGENIIGEIGEIKETLATLTGGEGGSISDTIDAAIQELDLDNTYEKVGVAKGLVDAVQGETEATVKSVEDSVTAIKDGTSIDSFADVEAALEGKQAVGDYATKTEARGYANAKDVAIQAAKQAGDDAMAEAQIKVASVVASDKSVTVAGTATAPTVAVKLDPAADNAIKLNENGLKVTNAEYSIVKDDASADYAAVYHLTKDGVNVGAAINIPKDMVVESGAVVENPDADHVGTFIKLVLQNVEEPLYINVGSLIEYVTSGSAVGDMVVVTIDETTHKVTASITDGTITNAKLANGTVEKAKLHSDVQASLDKADTALQASDIENKADKATTLAGYGITDAYTKGEVDTAVSSVDDKFAGYTNTEGMNTAIGTAKDEAIQAAEEYANGLADNYDAAGAAETAETNAKAYCDESLRWGTF